MTGYVRADTTDNIANNKVIDANDLDAEFNAVQAAFNEATGHSHDGSSAEGVPITKVGPTQDIEVTATEALPKTTEVVSLGTTLKKFKDLFLSGTATAASFVGNLTGNVTGNASTATSLATARNITLSGDVSGSASFDGTANVTITSTVADDSHTHDVRYYTKTESNVQFDEHPLKTLLISAGGGLTGGGSLEANRTISHADTSSQPSVNNSNGTVIQDITIDTYGHVTVLGSVNLDDRYYTEAELDSALGGKANAAVTISAGSGLTGGGTLAANRTISHADTSSSGGWTRSSDSHAITTINVDTYGHIVGYVQSDISEQFQRKDVTNAIYINGRVTAGGVASGPSFTVTKNGTGDYTINFETAYGSDDYVVIATCSGEQAIARLSTRTTSGCRILTYNFSGTAEDSDFHFIVVRN